MTKKSLVFIIPVVILPIFLAGCGFSLAGDVTPPPNAESYTAQDTPVPSGSTFPIVPADPSQGETIYNEQCADCHGDTGLGNGAQAGSLPVPVPALADPNVANTAKPSDWFTIVTKGNLEKYMPGFQSLGDRQRWDIVAYTLTLSMKAAEIGQGQLVYVEKCQSCHGEGGQGTNNAPNWQEDATRLAQYSLEDIVDITSSGINAMPGFANDLDAVDLQSVAVYTRMLSFANTTVQALTPAEASQGTPESTAIASTSAAPSLVTIQGKVTNGSGGTVPEGLQVGLIGYEGMNPVSEQQTSVKDGQYRFENVAVKPGDTYLVSIEYQGMGFESDVYHTSTDPVESMVDLPINIYDTTSDLSALRADRMHIFFDFTSADTVQVVELFILNNTGNRVIVPVQEGAGVVEYELPEGAVNLQFEDSAIGERYIQTEKGFSDMTQIGPGSGMQVLFAYNLPYSKKMSLNVPIPMDVDAAVVMVPANTLKLKSDQLTSAGQQDVQGVSLELYTSSTLTKGSTLSMDLSGSGNAGASLKPGNTSGLLIGAAVLGIVLLGVGYWLLRRQQLKRELAPVEVEPAQETAEDLIDAIIALDDRYKVGDLPEDAYQKRREELKAQLKSKMK